MRAASMIHADLKVNADINHCSCSEGGLAASKRFAEML